MIVQTDEVLICMLLFGNVQRVREQCYMQCIYCSWHNIWHNIVKHLIPLTKRLYMCITYILLKLYYLIRKQTAQQENWCKTMFVVMVKLRFT